MDTLCRHSSRWEEVACNTVLESLDSPILRLFYMPPERTPVLKKLTLKVSFPGASQEETTRVAEFKRSFHQSAPILTAPALQTLRLPRTWVPYTDMPVVWSQLTELAFTGYENTNRLNGAPLPFTPTSAFNLLRQCPNLQRCALSLSSERRAVNVGVVDPVIPPHTAPQRQSSLRGVQ